jgi:hypothetical protein
VVPCHYSADVRFRVLGPVETHTDDGRVLKLPRRHERCQLLTDVGEECYAALWKDHLGDIHQATGDTDTAQRIWRQAIAALDRYHHPYADTLRAKTRQAGAPTRPSLAPVAVR